MLISENYKVYERDFGAVGKTFSAVFSYVDQYMLPYYVMVGTGV